MYTEDISALQQSWEAYWERRWEREADELLEPEIDDEPDLPEDYDPPRVF